MSHECEWLASGASIISPGNVCYSLRNTLIMREENIFRAYIISRFTALISKKKKRKKREKEKKASLGAG